MSGDKKELLKEYEKDSVIFREGDEGSEMFIVHAGRVKLVKQFQTRMETLTILERGDFFGEMAVIEDLPRTATAISIEDGTSLIAIDNSQFEKMLQSNIEIAIRMIRKYAHRLLENNERMEKVLKDKQELDSGIQDILSNVRKKGERAEAGTVFGYLHTVDSKLQFSLKRPEALVGRRDSVTRQVPDVDLTDLDGYRTVSRRHARLTCLDDGFYLSEEVGVVNGTKLNGQQIPTGKLVRINHNDHIQFGQIEMKLELDLED